MGKGGEWIAYYGAALSTFLLVREIWKHRRATRPKLLGFLHPPRGGVELAARAPGQSEQRGETRIVSLHNRGGAATTLHKVHLCVAARWCPRMLLGLLGEFGYAPVSDQPEMRLNFTDRRHTGELAAGKETDVPVVLWEEHREALKQGRLMLNVVHTWGRDRPQQVQLRRVA